MTQIFPPLKDALENNQSISTVSPHAPYTVCSSLAESGNLGEEVQFALYWRISPSLVKNASGWLQDKSECMNFLYFQCAQTSIPKS